MSNKNIRIDFFTETVFRVRYSPSGKFIQAPPFICGESLPKPLRFGEKKTGSRVEVSSGFVRVNYKDDGKEPGKDNFKVRFCLEGFTGEFTLPFADDKNLGGTLRSLDNWKHHPEAHKWEEKGILSRNGFFVYGNKAQVYRDKKNKWFEVRKEEGARDYFIFVYGRDYKRALKDFITVFGRIPLLPKWAFGFWYSRYYAFTDKEVLKLIREYRKRGLPIDVMVIDTDWRKNSWNGFDWNKKYFQNPAKTLKEIHRLGCKVTLNDHPGYDRNDPLPPDDSTITQLKSELKIPPYKGQWGCDWSKKNVVEAYNRICLSKAFNEGMDFWWVDGWGEYPFDDVNQQMFLNRNYFNLREKMTKKRGLILSRWGGIGSHRYPVQFSGDTYSTWDTLRYQIYFTASGGNIGAAYWSHDIGGFFDEKIPEELFIRWVQFCIFSPIFRTHSHHGIREPWNFGKRTDGIFKQYLKMRYALLPYFYTLSKSCHDEGLPPVRPMYLEYPREEGAYKAHYQYLLGKDILVIPADGPVNKETGSYPKSAYFPTGEWVNIWTGETVRGIENRMLQISKEKMALYVRKGAIIPFYEEMSRTMEKMRPDIHLDIYPDIEGYSEIFEDDGESLDYQKGVFDLIRIKTRKTGSIVRINIDGVKSRRSFFVNVMLEPGEEPVSVSIDGKQASFKKTNECWTGLVNTGARFINLNVCVSGRAEIVIILK